MFFLILFHKTQVSSQNKAAKRPLEQIFTERRQHLQETCAMLNLSSTTFNDKTIKLFSHVFVIPKYKLMYCDIPKVSSTSWKRLLLVLHGESLFRDPKQTKQNAHHVAERRFRRLSKYKLTEAKRLMKEYTSFVFVRNPFSRLLSAYKSKMLNPGKREQHRKTMVMRWLASNKSLLTNYTNKGITFSQFVTYYLNTEKRDIHWRDMYQLCYPCLFNYSIIGNYETLKADSDYIFDIIKAPSDVTFPVPKNAVTQSSKDSTLVKYYAELTDGQLRNLSVIPGFKRDLQLFDYEMPQSINRSLAGR